MKQPIVIGTRGSELALWQAHFVQESLKQIGVESVLEIIRTQGDNVQHLSLDKLEGKGFFTKEIEEALLQNRVDIAVHSHKDLETEQPGGLVIAAVSHRAEPNDVLLLRKSEVDTTKLFDMKENAVLGTSSARRKAQILHHRADVTLKDIRGNVPTRVQKLRDGQYDAILMAKAGLDRLGLDLSDLHVVVLPVDAFVPAPAQGVLAIQCRESDTELREVLAKLNHADVAELIGLERGVLNKMNGGCHMPLGVYATYEEEEYCVQVSVAKTWDAPTRMLTFVSDRTEGLVELIVQQIS